MYIGFELNDYQPLRKVHRHETHALEEQAKGTFDKLSEYMVVKFQGRDVIDAGQLADHLFPTKRAHVFLSHSHRDADQAIELAVALQDKGLNVFVDSCVWGYFPKLLDALNEVYAEPKRKPEGGVVYDYRKATDLAAGVHMMLAGALQAMIDRSELFVFLNTNNSVPMTNFAGVDQTFSPWIYSELQFSATARTRAPLRHQITMDSVSIEEQRHFKAIASSEALLSFKAFNKHLPKVNGGELKTWFTGAHERGTRALDSLYGASDIPENFFRLREALEKPELLGS